MVRTFLCHPFTDPRAFTDHYDPTAVCYTADDRVIIAASNGVLHIHDLKSTGCPELQKFPGVGIPIKLLFCDSKQFILSLEVKFQEFKSETVNCQARVYLHFEKNNSSKAPTPLNCGYLNNVRSSNYTKYVNNIVLDLGTGSSVSDVAICPIKNNIAVSSGKKISIFAIREIQDENGRRIIDFNKIIEISLTVSIQSVILAVNWVAIASKREIRVLQVFLSQPEDDNIYQAEDVSKFLESCSLSTEGEENVRGRNCEVSVVNESITLDNNFMVWDFNNQNSVYIASMSPDRRRSFIKTVPNHFEFDSEKNVINLVTIKKEVPYQDKTNTAKEIFGPIDGLVGHPLHCTVVYTNMNPGQSQFFRTASCVTLLYRRFSSSEMSNFGDVDALHSLQWMPVFIEGSSDVERKESNEEWPWTMFNVPTSPSLLTMALFFSTGKEGFLYDINGKNIERSARWNYTSDCVAAVHTRSLLYAVNKNGLEAYTSRLYALASEQCCSKYKHEDFENKSFNPQKVISQHHAKTRTDTELFTDLNYYEGYVSIADTGAIKCDEGNRSLDDISTLLTYSPFNLMLPCPSLHLDVCLVGMYVLKDIFIIGCSTSYLVLLVKADHTNFKEPKHSIGIPPWSIYVLEMTPVVDFYNELMGLIDGNEFNNPTIYFHLSNEAQLMLRSELISGSNEEVEIRISMKQSTLKIANFLSRCVENFCDDLISKYYKMADLTFQDVIKMHFDHDVTKEKKYIFGSGFMKYLNYHLFGVEDITLNLEYSEFVLKIYMKNKSSDLSAIILKSKLQTFSNELALHLMVKYKSKQESKGRNMNPYDSLCIAVLYMRVGNPTLAEDTVKEIPQETFQKLCVENEEFLFTRDLQITPFAQLIKKHFKASFTAILVSMFDLGKLSLENIVNILRKQDDYSSFNNQACKVCETLLNDGHQKKHAKILDYLIDQYITHLVEISKGSSSNGWKNNHQHIPKGNGHFASRYSWLNKLLPFTGDSPVPQDCVSSRNKGTGEAVAMPKSLPNTKTRKQEESPHLSSFPKNNKDLHGRIYCPCCCCSEILLKFQALLCSRYNRKDLSTKVLSKLRNTTFVGKESLLLLCWPRAGFCKEAVDYMIRNYPSSMLSYAKDMFDWKAQWQVLLQHLLVVLKENDYEQWNHDTYMDLLKGILHRLTNVYTPAEFLSFLPTDGSMLFFLPFLHKCWEYNKSATLKEQFLKTYATESETSKEL